MFPYLMVLLALLAATGIRWLLDPVLGDHLPYHLYVVVVAIIAWSYGLGPALLTLLTGFVISEYLFFTPRYVIPPIGYTVTHWIGATNYLMVTGIIVGIIEVLRRSERREYRSKELLRTTLASIGDAVLTTDTKARIVGLNPVAETLTGWRIDEAAGRPIGEVLRIVNEDTREPANNPIERVLVEGNVVGLANHTILIAKDGNECPIDDSAAPIRDSEGHLIGVVMVFRDVTERRKAELQRETLANELAHRVKNTMTIVQSIAEMTARSTDDPVQFRDAFFERLHSITRCHDILTNRAWQGATLRELLELTFAPYRERDGVSIEIHGPEVDLPPQAALSIGMVLHELTTNAVKYGALAQTSGHLQVTWMINAGMLILDWIERGGPPARSPTRKGFGTKLIEGTFKQLGGSFECTYAPDGFSCRCEIPLA